MADPNMCCTADQRSHENKEAKFQKDEDSGADRQWRDSLSGTDIGLTFQNKQDLDMVKFYREELGGLLSSDGRALVLPQKLFNQVCGCPRLGYPLCRVFLGV